MGNLIGRSLAHFRIEAALGEGGMGVVYRATDEKLRRQAALKVLPDSFAQDESRRRRFLREARAAAAVAHANIATVHEVGEADGLVFIAMELVDGETLRARIDEGVSVAEAVRIAKEIARGLGRAHEKGIVHRDLKPENVMITPHGDVKILDFGLAKMAGDSPATPSVLQVQETATALTREGRLLGTPAYMPPEQARGQDVDPRTDVFALGVILHEMVTGGRPFVGETTQDVLTAIMRDPPKRASADNPNVPAELDLVIERCLEKPPDARYASGQEVWDALSTVLPERRVAEPGVRKGPSAPTVSLLTPDASSVGPRAYARRRWAVLAVTGLAALGLGLGYRARGRRATATNESEQAAPSASAPAAAPTKMVDLPMPASTHPDALLAYRKGRQDYHDGSLWRGGVEMTSAWRLDPSLAAPLLTQLAWANDGDQTTFSTARQLRTTLSERDQALLDATAPIYASEKADLAAAAERFSAVATRWPGDAEAQLLAGYWLGQVGRVREAYAAFDRALAGDPSFASVHWARAMIEPDANDRERELDACVATSPTAASCVRTLASMRQQAGQCDAMGTLANRLAVIEPDFEWSYAYTLNAVLERGGTREETAPVLQAMDSSLRAQSRADGQKERKSRWPALVSAHFGAFDEALKFLDGLEPDDRPTRISIEIAMESGDVHRAASEARAYVAKRASNLAGDPRVDALALRLVQQAANQSPETIARLAIKWGKQDSPTEAGLPDLIVRAGAAASPAAAREATEGASLALPRFEAISSYAFLGHAFAMAGRANDALPFLRVASRACGMVEPSSYFGIDRVQARLDLAEVLARNGDRAEACEWLAKIVAQWGEAKPRSVTADKARERARALACPR